MEALIVLGLMVAVAGLLVWRLTARPGGEQRRPRLRFLDTFQTTRPEAATGNPGTEGFAYSPARRPEERPSRFFTVARLLAIVLVVSAGIAAGLYYLGYFVKLQLDKYLGS